MSTTMTVLAEAERRAKLAGIPAALLVPFVEAEIVKHPFRIDYAVLNYPMLVDVKFIGDQTTVLINTEHPWVAYFVLAPRVSERSRSQIEVFLATLAGFDTRDPHERRLYDVEMHSWGERLWAATNVMTEAGKDGFNMLGDDPDQWLHPDDDDEEFA